jgi:capsular exopolysaccharide synthesis family protein
MNGPQQIPGFSPNPFVKAQPTPPPIGGRSLPSIAELIHSFKRRWVLSLLIGGLVGIFLAAAIWMALPAGKHRIQAILRFNSSNPNPLATGPNQRPSETEFLRMMEGHMTDLQTKSFLTTVANQPEVNRLSVLANADDKSVAIKEMLKLKNDPAEIITLTMNGDMDRDLKTILAAIVDQYKVDVEEKETRKNKLLLQTSQTALAALQKRIAETREKTQQKVKESGQIAIDSGSGLLVLDIQIRKTTDELGSSREKLNTLKAQREQLSKRIAEENYTPDKEAIEELLAKSEAVKQRQDALQKAEEDYAKNAPRLVADNPVLKELVDRKTKAAAALEEEKARVSRASDALLRSKQKASMQDRLAVISANIEVEQKLHEAAERHLKTLQEDHKKMLENNLFLRHDKEDTDPLVVQQNELVRRISDLEFLTTNSIPRMDIVENAQIYPNYNLKQKMAFAIGGAIFGLLGVTLLISYLEWRNRRVDGVDQVVTELNMRVIGTIPAFPSRNALRSGEASQNQNWRFILNESVNSTRTMLLHTAKTQQMQVLLVTSAMQGEGKTSLSSQLATSMATAGLRTLILDCDLRNPSMQKLFDIPVAPGCAEILLQEIDISDAVQQTSVPNLWIIPAGQCNHRVIAALAQGHPLEALFNRLRGQFDIVVVDSCPILPVADTLLVAQHVDGVVFSILQDVSQLPKVQDASDRLVQLNIPLLGAVVNGIKPDVQAYGYNYVKQLPA